MNAGPPEAWWNVKVFTFCTGKAHEGRERQQKWPEMELKSFVITFIIE